MGLRRYILFSLILCSLSVNADARRWRTYATAASQVGVREATGHNDGVDVEKYLRFVGLRKGYPYCAAFVAWVYAQDCIKNPRSALAADYFRDKSKIIYDRRVKTNRPIHMMDVFGIYFANMNGIHHVGFIIKWGAFVDTIEANTSDANTGSGTREGDGVYRKRRLAKQIYMIANYIDE